MNVGNSQGTRVLGTNVRRRRVALIDDDGVVNIGHWLACQLALRESPTELWTYPCSQRT